MERIGAVAEDCEGVVNYLISIAGVESAVFLREVSEASQFRLSIRSKGKLDVAQIAEHFGGAAIAAPAAAPSTALWTWPPSASSPSLGQDSDSLVSLRIDK